MTKFGNWLRKPKEKWLGLENKAKAYAPLAVEMVESVKKFMGSDTAKIIIINNQ